MDVRGLKYFIRAAECLNFTRAAKECYITQTAMSLHIANMEKELGFQLFYRDNRNVNLTPAGHNFYEHARMIIQSYDSAVRQSQNLSDGSSGTLTISISSCLEGFVFLPRLKHFRDEYPMVKLILRVCKPCNMVDQIKRGTTDIGITWPYDMAEMNGISVQDLANFKSCLACSSSNELAKCKSVSLEDLANERIMMLDLHGMPATYRVMCEDWMRISMIPPAVRTFEQIDSLDELMLAVGVENAVTLVPEIVKNNTIIGMTYIPLDIKNVPMYKTSAGYLTDNQNPALSAALDALRDARIPLNY